MTYAVKWAFLTLFFAGLGGLLLAGNGLAQTAPKMPREPKANVERKDSLLKDIPDGAKDRKELLGELYKRLSQSKDGESSKVVATAIEKLWLHSGSDTVDLLMTRVGA
ncbi:MAG: hypothetical protein ACR2OX_02525, partial [Methyloligellaceae bacterium]